MNSLDELQAALRANKTPFPGKWVACISEDDIDLLERVIFQRPTPQRSVQLRYGRWLDVWRDMIQAFPKKAPEAFRLRFQRIVDKGVPSAPFFFFVAWEYQCRHARKVLHEAQKSPTEEAGGRAKKARQAARKTGKTISVLQESLSEIEGTGFVWTSAEVTLAELPEILKRVQDTIEQERDFLVGQGSHFSNEDRRKIHRYLSDSRTHLEFPIAAQGDINFRPQEYLPREKRILKGMEKLLSQTETYRGRRGIAAEIARVFEDMGIPNYLPSTDSGEALRKNLESWEKEKYNPFHPAVEPEWAAMKICGRLNIH